MKLVIGSDHAGFGLKCAVVDRLRAQGHELCDMGSYDPNPVDFPDIAKKVCAAVLKGEAERGVMFCGTGVGAAIACNKVRGIRAAVCHDIYSAHQCVEHDNVQIIAMGGQIIGDMVAVDIIGAFLSAKFSDGEEFRRRVAKLETMDAERQ
jgi:ribose 5-phosphate isomerase B